MLIDGLMTDGLISMTCLEPPRNLFWDPLQSELFLNVGDSFSCHLALVVSNVQFPFRSLLLSLVVYISLLPSVAMEFSIECRSMHSELYRNLGERFSAVL